MSPEHSYTWERTAEAGTVTPATITSSITPQDPVLCSLPPATPVCRALQGTKAPLAGSGSGGGGGDSATFYLVQVFKSYQSFCNIHEYKAILIMIVIYYANLS